MTLLEAVQQVGYSTDTHQAIFAKSPMHPQSEAVFCSRQVDGARAEVPAHFEYIATFDLVGQTGLQYPEFTEDEAIYIVYELLGW